MFFVVFLGKMFANISSYFRKQNNIMQKWAISKNQNLHNSMCDFHSSFDQQIRFEKFPLISFWSGYMKMIRSVADPDPPHCVIQLVILGMEAWLLRLQQMQNYCNK